MTAEMGGGGCLDDWEMEGWGHRFLPRGRQIPEIGVKREGRVMGTEGKVPKGPEPQERRKEARVC